PALFDTRSPAACRAKAPPVASGLQPSPCDRGGAPARGARCRRPQCRGRNGEAPARRLGRPRRGSPRPLPTWSSTGFAKLSTGGKSIIALLWPRMDTYAMNITETDISIKGPSDLVCTVPLLLGFHPEHSLVVVGLSGSDLKCTFRIDLPGSADHIEHLLDLTGQLCRNGCDRCVLIAYGEREVTEAAIARTAQRFDAAGIESVDRLRVTEGRCFGLDCERECCPPEGRPVPQTSPASCEVAVSGGYALPDRSAVAAQLDPAEPDRRAAVAA